MKKILTTHRYLFFFIGAFLGLSLTVISAWADLEASFYGFSRTGGKRLSTLSCPIIMTANETSSFSIKITNTTDRKISPSVKTDISSPIDPITSYESVQLGAGESKRMQWEIGPENIDVGRFIFVRAWVYAAYPMPDHENFCGVFVINLPTNGRLITWAMIILSLLGMGGGIYGLMHSEGFKRRTETDIAGFRLIAILVCAGVAASFLGWWVPAMMTLVVALLMLVVVAGHTLRS